MVGRSVRVTVAAMALALGLWPVLAGAQAAPKVSFSSPAEGSTVTGPKVEVKLSLENFRTVAAGTAVAAGEGHAHLFVDRDPPAAGAAIPTDQPNIVHMGAAPFDTRSLDLTPGRHTIHAVLGDSAHKALTPLATAKVTFTVAQQGAAAPQRPSATGDGSLADDGLPGGAVAVLVVLGVVAAGLAGRLVIRRNLV